MLILQHSFRFSVIAFMLCSILSVAQTTELVYNDRDTSYIGNPFMQSFGLIKPHAFKDGSYLIYTDGKKNNILFKGFIKEGKTNGIYYSYKKNNSDSVLRESKTVLKTREGKFDGWCKLLAFNTYNICYQYHFLFYKGVLQKVKITDAFMSENGFNNPLDLDSNTTRKSTDTLVLSFNKQKIECVQFLRSENSFTIKSPLSNTCINDSTELETALPIASIYKNNGANDSMQISFQKQYSIKTKKSSVEGHLQFQYDSLKQFNRFVLNSWFFVDYSNHINFDLFEIRFSKKNNDWMVKCTIGFEPIESYPEDLTSKDEPQILYIDNSNYFYFNSNWVLDMNDQ
ncbi:MAG: hypothetical protein IPP32_02850 [Bacteroidetes bacterium]|nr:hypothetical protein [Bacteroidota bacterium]